jgi:hypothetical protein
MRNLGCLVWGHEWRRLRRDDGTYLRCTRCGHERLDEDTGYGTGGTGYLSGGGS